MAIAAAADSTADEALNPTSDDSAGNSGKDSRLPDRGEANADGEDDEYEEVEEELDGPPALAAEKEKIETVFRRLSSAPVPIRVHDIIIKGNSKTRDALIEAEVTDLIRSAVTVQDLVRAASLASGRLRNLDVFDSVHITLDAGPPELPGTTTVVVEVVETANPISGSVGYFSRAEEFDVRGAVPFGFCNAALNAGIAAGVIVPLGRGFLKSPSPVPDRFFLGGHASPVCSLGGLNSLLGFKTRGVGPAEVRRFVPSESVADDSAVYPGLDYLGGDFAVSAFADLSFDLPLKLFRDAGIYGHAFLMTGNVAKLSESEFRNFSFAEFGRTFRSSVGVGIIFPTKLCRVEVNYCHILKKCEHDRGKSGVQFSFSLPM
ncbi:hypothetical protein PR202_gb04337 [Eleusine coracana subsp. coracana]|uniref:Bacterial surface antigen (D15) domain-containing protein n=1 Tax=Eleusine coracana subsp. coracana TaxID=191504 RepID=A0AAV5E3M7_ELECO|nr:hypothetical protein PR202_gb04337 [Eleusine coracana subsp. coracana]